MGVCFDTGLPRGVDRALLAHPGSGCAHAQETHTGGRLGRARAGEACPAGQCCVCAGKCAPSLAQASLLVCVEGGCRESDFKHKAAKVHH